MAWKSTYSVSDLYQIADTYSTNAVRESSINSGGSIVNRTVETYTRTQSYEYDGYTEAAALSAASQSSSSSSGSGYVQTVTTDISPAKSGGANKWKVVKVVVTTRTTYGSWS